jgi:uncharacterized protein (TIGR00369 family)
MLVSDRPSGFDVAIPFVEYSGIRLLETTVERVVTELNLAEHHLNSAGYAHGGAVMTLLDVTMAIAGRMVARDPGPKDTVMATVEMKTSFMQGGRGRLRCTGSCVHQTRSLAFCEAEIRDEAGQLVARASGTFRFMARRRSPSDG